MKEPPDGIRLRLLFILHRGFVEARLLAGANKSKQVFDLADALELIPGMLKGWHEGDLEQARSLLKTYQDKYPEGFDFIAHLSDQGPLPLILAMIAKDKETAAMKALQSVIIRGRAMAYEKADHSKLGDLLDRAEYLAGMLYEERDMTETFRANLVELASLHQCGIALTVDSVFMSDLTSFSTLAGVRQIEATSAAIIDNSCCHYA